MALSTMYTGKNNSPQTDITAAIQASDTVIAVSDILAFPDAPNLATIGTDENAEVIRYNGISGSTLTGCERGFGGTTASQWDAGTVISRQITKYDIDTLQGNINELNTSKANTADLGDLATQNSIDLDTQVSGVLKMSNGGTGGSSSILYLRPGDSFTIGTGVTGFPALASASFVYFTVSTTYPIRSDVNSAALSASQIAFRTQSKQVNISNVELTSYAINRCGFVFQYPNENNTFETTDIINASFRSKSGTITLS